MNNKEIEDGNRLIALFMGYKESESGYYPEVPDEYDYKGRIISVGPYQGDKPLNMFHQSWDWLIPSIQKIIGMKEFDEIQEESDAWYAYYSIESMILWATPLQVFERVITVLKWHKENE